MIHISLIRLKVSTFVQWLEERLSNVEAFCPRTDGSHFLTMRGVSLKKASTERLKEFKEEQKNRFPAPMAACLLYIRIF